MPSAKLVSSRRDSVRQLWIAHAGEQFTGSVTCPPNAPSSSPYNHSYRYPLSPIFSSEIVKHSKLLELADVPQLKSPEPSSDPEATLASLQCPTRSCLELPLHDFRHSLLCR